MKIDILKKQIFSTIFQARIPNIHKYFLSETIHAQENGSRGTHFAKFLISNFLKGLTYSALYGVNNSSVCSMNAMFGSLQFKTQSTVLKSTSYILKYFDPGVLQ